MWTLPSQFLQPFSACRFGIETSAKICGLIGLQVVASKTRYNLYGLDMLIAPDGSYSASIDLRYVLMAANPDPLDSISAAPTSDG